MYPVDASLIGHSAPSLSHVRSKMAIIVSIINRFMTFMTYALRDLSDISTAQSLAIQICRGDSFCRVSFESCLGGVLVLSQPSVHPPGLDSRRLLCIFV
jgi:hypothetical protein